LGFILFLFTRQLSDFSQIRIGGLDELEISSIFAPGVKGTTIVSYVLYIPDTVPKEARHGTNKVYKQCLSNLEVFLERGVAKDPKVAYVFSLIGETKCPKALAKVALAMPESVFLVRSPKYGVDLYAHGDVVRRLRNTTETLVALNCGARGPYIELQSDSRRLLPSTRWIDAFTSRFDVHANTKAVGVTISCEITAHIQSYAMVVTNDAIDVLADMWSPHIMRGVQDKLKIISSQEVGASVVLKQRGINIAALNEEQGRDFRDGRETVCAPEFANSTAFAERPILFNPTVCRPDTTFPTPGCRGLKPCQMVFVKYGGETLRDGYIPKSTIRLVKQEDQRAKLLWSPKLCSSES